MPCYCPVKGYRSKHLNKSGKRSIVFRPNDGFIDMPVYLPCGQCIGCRLERSRQWAIRCVHEASLYNENCFITLTFNNEHLDPLKSLRKTDYQLFMKRLRKEVGKVRYFHCGEYGETTQRPHHHACLFGYKFPDLKLFSVRNGATLYTSKILEKIWGQGFCTVGEVTFESCAYVARYIMKKVTGEESEEYYKDRIPPYVTMSRRPGIGSDWFKKFKGDVFPDDICVIRPDVISKPPKFYLNELEARDPDQFKAIKKRRSQQAVKKNLENTWDRLGQKEEAKRLQLNKLVRNI